MDPTDYLARLMTLAHVLRALPGRIDHHEVKLDGEESIAALVANGGERWVWLHDGRAMEGVDMEISGVKFVARYHREATQEEIAQLAKVEPTAPPATRSTYFKAEQAA